VDAERNASVPSLRPLLVVVGLAAVGVSGGGLTGWINGNSSLQAVSTGLVVEVVVGLVSALMWSRRRPRKWGSWLRSAPLNGD
jgi:hypothetical protein